MDHGVDAGTILQLMEALESSGLGTQARTSTWLYPLVSVLHVLGVALLVGSIVVFDLRVLGVARRLPLDACAAYLLPIARIALAVQVVTGLVMFAADADHVYANPFFLAKLSLIGLALVNILVFHGLAGTRPYVYELDAVEALPAWAKASAAVSLIAWIGVACFGRMIAYV
jgi:hypothetical protein